MLGEIPRIIPESINDHWPILVDASPNDGEWTPVCVVDQRWTSVNGCPRAKFSACLVQFAPYTLSA